MVSCLLGSFMLEGSFTGLQKTSYLPCYEFAPMISEENEAIVTIFFKSLYCMLHSQGTQRHTVRVEMP